MQRVLFHSTIFGPVKSRRLGVSLGINLSPNDGKICSFDCLYCEAGFNAQGPGHTGFPQVSKVLSDLERTLVKMQSENELPDVLTFSGNGEPTMHPQFGEIVDGVIELRNKYAPLAKISVLSNATMLHKNDVVEALKKVDNAIMKLDSGIDDTIRVLDRPNAGDFNVNAIKEGIKKIGSDVIVQTMLLRGSKDGKEIDNTTEHEINSLIGVLEDINPGGVMLYSIDRKTPYNNLVKVEKAEMEHIAHKMRAAGLRNVTVS